MTDHPPLSSTDLLADAFGRLRDLVRSTVDGLDADALRYRPDPGANTVAWLIWHLTRVQDDHVADAAGHEQVWTAEGWAERFDLPFERTATGYGQGAADVGRVEAPAELLAGYHDAVIARTLQFLASVPDDDLDRVVDEAWDPPVTLGVRLVSVLVDDLQHVGQAAYLRGLAERAG